MNSPIDVVTAAYVTAFTPDHFFVGQQEYRLTTLGLEEPPLAWDVFVSDHGDIVVSKRDGLGFIRPQLTRNEGYLMVSILRAEERAEDRYLRRRVHVWVANAFHGRAPSPDALVEHLNDDPSDNFAANLRWATAAEKGGGPPLFTASTDLLGLAGRGAEERLFTMVKDLRVMIGRASNGSGRGPALGPELRRLEPVVVGEMAAWAAYEGATKRELRQLMRDYATVADAADLCLGGTYVESALVAQMAAVVATLAWVGRL